MRSCGRTGIGLVTMDRLADGWHQLYVKRVQIGTKLSEVLPILKSSADAHLPKGTPYEIKGSVQSFLTRDPIFKWGWVHEPWMYKAQDRGEWKGAVSDG